MIYFFVVVFLAVNSIPRSLLQQQFFLKKSNTLFLFYFFKVQILLSYGATGNISCAILIFVSINTSEHLSILSKTFTAALSSLWFISWLLLPLILLILKGRNYLTLWSILWMVVLPVVICLVFFTFNFSSILFSMLLNFYRVSPKDLPLK